MQRIIIMWGPHYTSQSELRTELPHTSPWRSASGCCWSRTVRQQSHLMSTLVKASCSLICSFTYRGEAREAGAGLAQRIVTQCHHYTSQSVLQFDLQPFSPVRSA
jgi:hypothetical protein